MINPLRLLTRFWGMPWWAAVLWLALGVGSTWAMWAEREAIHAPALPVRDSELWELNPE